MNADLLDVVVRFHDPRRMSELDRCVFSIVTQKYAPVNVLIVCQRFSQEELTLVSERLQSTLAIGSGVAVAIRNFTDDEPRDARSMLLNTGIAEGRGRFIAFLDYDDIIYPDGYQLLIDELSRSACAIAFGRIRWATVAVEGNVFRVLGKRLNFIGYNLHDLFRENFCPIHSFVIDRSKIPPQMLYFDPGMSRLEDYDLLIRLCTQYPASFRQVDRIIGEYYVKNDGSNTIIVPSNSAPERCSEWDQAREIIAQRRRETLIHPTVQRNLGIAKPHPAMTVAEFLRGSPAAS